MSTTGEAALPWEEEDPVRLQWAWLGTYVVMYVEQCDSLPLPFSPPPPPPLSPLPLSPPRYKARYRQLLFNLKDEKNEVLFRKVVHKEIKTSQLVLMSHDQLASEELSKWREEELKKVCPLSPPTCTLL